MKTSICSLLKSPLCVLLLWLSPPLSAQQVISGSFQSGGSNRSYIGALPSQQQGALRLVILLSGARESASQMELRGFNSYLGDSSMVVYPEPFNLNLGFGNSAGVNDFQMVEDLISAIDSLYFINRNDICIGGFSNGGIFTYNLVCEFNSPGTNRPYSFKSFAIVSGAMEAGQANSSGCPIADEVPAIVFHGTQDPIMAYGGGNVPPPVSISTESTETAVDFWANQINACSGNFAVTALPDNVTETPLPSSVELLEYTCNSTPATRLYRINGGRHAWPGGNASIDIAQSRNMDINASALIAQFFRSTNTLSTYDNALNPNSLLVYPNPVRDILSIETRHTLEKVEIYNMSGQQVYVNVQGDSQVAMVDLRPGIYFLKIETEAGTYLDKVVKE